MTFSEVTTYINNYLRINIFNAIDNYYGAKILDKAVKDDITNLETDNQCIF